MSAAGAPLADLPPLTWRCIIQGLPLRECFRAALVSTAWRDVALYVLTQEPLHVVLVSGNSAAAGFGRWLAAHGHRLTALTLQETAFCPPDRAVAPARVVGRAPGGANDDDDDGFPDPPGGGVHRRRISSLARLRLWHGLNGGGTGRPLPRLASLEVLLDDFGASDAVALGMVCMPHLTHLHLQSNASAIGVLGAAGLAPLTTLRSLVLPTQAVGDEGLQLLAGALHNLVELSLHNDGHVSGQGLGYLGGLQALTYLDLQGSVSITSAALPTLAAALPRLRRLNLAFCRSVDDAGVAELDSLRQLEELNLCGTAACCASERAMAALADMCSLTSLVLSRSHVAGEGLSGLARSLTALRALDLSSCMHLASVIELAPLSRMKRLTRLDVSHCVRAFSEFSPELTALATLTQLRHLAANYLPSADSLSRAWVLESCANYVSPFNEGDHSTIYDCLASLAAARRAAVRASSAAAAVAPTADATAAGGSAQPVAAAAPPPAAPAAAPTLWGWRRQRQQQQQQSDIVPSGWQRLLLALPQLAGQLTALEFAGNLSSRAGQLSARGVEEAAVVLLGFATAGARLGPGGLPLRRLDLAAQPRGRSELLDNPSPSPSLALRQVARLLLAAVGSGPDDDEQQHAQPFDAAPPAVTATALHKAAKEAAGCSRLPSSKEAALIVMRLAPQLQMLRVLHPSAAQQTPDYGWLDVPVLAAEA